MQTLSSAGVSYRTQLMERAAAERFAAMIRGNKWFTGGELEESSRAKVGNPKRFFVSYQPARETRQAELQQAHQDVQQQRAAAQGGNYEFVLDTDARFFWCLNLETGETYETTERSCNCPQHQYRTGPAGLYCKHIHMLREGHSPVRGW